MSSVAAPRLASSLLLLVLLVVSLVAESSSAISGARADAVALLNFAAGGDADGSAGLVPSSTRTCGGLVGDCIHEEEEMMMESEISRRGLQQRSRYISYQALMKDRVPCNRRGDSYYNCQKGGQKRANPYRRGCTYITHCARNLN